MASSRSSTLASLTIEADERLTTTSTDSSASGQTGHDRLVGEVPSADAAASRISLGLLDPAPVAIIATPRSSARPSATLTVSTCGRPG